MKKNLVLVLVLIVALVACNDTKKPSGKGNKAKSETKKTEDKEEKSLSIVCVDIDSLQENYKYYKDVQKQLEQEGNAAEASITQKTKSLGQKVQSLQNRAQKGQLTQAQYEKEALALQKEEANIGNLQQKLSVQLQEKSSKKQEEVMKIINDKMKEYADDKGYDIIITKNSVVTNVLYVNEAYDVTEEVIEMLNKDYKK